MAEIDFGNIYNANGKIVQLRYAQKTIDRGSTILGFSNNKAVVLVVCKPIVSKLHVQENNHRIKRLSSNAHVAYTGILTDGVVAASYIKENLSNYNKNYGIEPTAEFIKSQMNEIMYLFTSYASVRIIGASFLTAVKSDGEYKLITSDCSGDVAEYRARAFGAGERRATTELDKLDVLNMDVEEMIDQGIKILFMCHDPLVDLKFTAEVMYASEDTDGSFVRLEESKISELLEKYKDVSIEGDGE
ncbi:20S proteasome subunit alpha 7 [Enteropsectra breve]|nr:20S proteasome subunit alpha 7 [Enteropsectra breve]